MKIKNVKESLILDLGSSQCIRPIPDKNKKEVIDMVKDLEKVKDVSAIIRLLT